MNHLSYSQINLFSECAKLWQAGYRQNKKSVANNDLVFGSAVHKALENRIAGVPEAEDILAYWAKIWWQEFAVQKNVAWHLSQEECFETGVRIFSSKQVMDLVDSIEPLYMKGQPVIERKIEWHLEGVPTIIGYIDCMASDGVPIDFKTASQMWSPGQARAEKQPLFYIAALDSLGEFDHQYRFRHFIITKGAFPAARVFETQRTVEQVENMKREVREVWAKISAAEFVPNSSSWLCTMGCPVLDECEPGQLRHYGSIS